MESKKNIHIRPEYGISAMRCPPAYRAMVSVTGGQVVAP